MKNKTDFTSLWLDNLKELSCDLELKFSSKTLHLISSFEFNNMPYCIETLVTRTLPYETLSGKPPTNDDTVLTTRFIYTIGQVEGATYAPETINPKFNPSDELGFLVLKTVFTDLELELVRYNSLQNSWGLIDKLGGAV